MPFSPVSWANREELSSAKLAQMIENLRTHDHRFDGTQGAAIARWATGEGTFSPVANTSTYLTVTYPVGRFDPAGPVPIPVVSLGSTVIGTSVLGWGTNSHSHASFEAYIHRINNTATPFSWVAIQAPA